MEAKFETFVKLARELNEKFDSVPEIGSVEIPVFSVAEFSNLLKGTIEAAFGRVKVKGEIIGLRRHSSGTTYFDLKESAGGKDYILNCVLWKWTKADVKLEDGLEVIVGGKASAYTGRSSYQISVESVEVAGIGALFKIIEERKKKLASEGLFDIVRKKPIPKYPRIIGVATSPTGAVIRDIIHRVSDRWPAKIIVWETAVQGEGAEIQIAAAIDGFNRMEDGRPDVIVVARGGGSLQDLMPFNEEIVVRAAANSAIPLISAVGHETDTTLIDYAASLRAPTPTAAAELAVPVRSELLLSLSGYAARMMSLGLRILENAELKARGLWARMKSPAQVIADLVQRLDDKWSRMELAVSGRFKTSADLMSYFGKMLESYSFKSVLGRGYAIVRAGGGILESTAELAAEGSGILEMRDGKIGISARADASKKKRAPDGAGAKEPGDGKDGGGRQGDLF